MAVLNFRASGNIAPSRFVTISGPGTVAQAGDNADVIGVSHEGTQRAPLSDYGGTPLAAQAGQSIAVYSVGEICLLEAGGTISAGQLLRSDSSGRGVPVETTGTTIRNYGAVALDSATGSGQKIRVFVVPLNKIRPALS